jgi:hypothetical protein
VRERERERLIIIGKIAKIVKCSSFLEARLRIEDG